MFTTVSGAIADRNGDGSVNGLDLTISNLTGAGASNKSFNLAVIDSGTGAVSIAPEPGSSFSVDLTLRIDYEIETPGSSGGGLRVFSSSDPTGFTVDLSDSLITSSGSTTIFVALGSATTSALQSGYLEVSYDDLLFARYADHSSSANFAIASSAVEPTPIVASIQGTISLQSVSATGSLVAFSPMVIATAIPSGDSFAAVIDGSSYSFGSLAAGEYEITVTADGFLPISFNMTISGNGTVVASIVELRAGLVDDDSVVSIRDISAIAASFGQVVANRRDRLNRIVDINADGIVDLLDLSAVASNFGAAGP